MIKYYGLALLSCSPFQSVILLLELKSYSSFLRLPYSSRFMYVAELKGLHTIWDPELKSTQCTAAAAGSAGEAFARSATEIAGL